MKHAPVAALLGTCLLLSACSEPAPPEAGPDLEELRRQVAGVRASVKARLAPETLLSDSGVRDADVALRLRGPMLVEVISRVAGRYLDDVSLDLRPEVVVREGEEVRLPVGPLRVRAGRWDLTVTIRRIEARLRGGSPEVGVADDGERLRISLPVEVLGGSGEAEVGFRWDAAGVAEAVCRDFDVEETFTATVAPRTYTLEGGLDVSLRDAGIAIDPDFGQRLLVQPEPTAESWRRVRELLERQDRIYRCGIALDPADMEESLRRLVRRGFRFQLPESVLRPILLPGRVAESVTVSGRELRVAASAAGLRLGSGWLWYGLDLGVEPVD